MRSAIPTSFLICCAAAGVLCAAYPAAGAPLQAPATAAKKPNTQAKPGATGAAADDEERQIRAAFEGVGNSPVEFIRAAERYLSQHPQSARRESLEQAILKAAIDARDNKRIIAYGEKFLGYGNDPMLHNYIARAYLASDDADSARKSLEHSEALQKLIEAERTVSGPSKVDPQSREDVDKLYARALVLEARAHGNLGELEQAITLAKRSYEGYPSAEAMQEAGRWEVKANLLEDAVEDYADAFMIPDGRVTDEERSNYRARLRELYTKLHGSENGLGDLILKAYDRTNEVVRGRQALAHAAAPNKAIIDAFEYELAGLKGDSVRLGDYPGTVLVLDFWATWCGPCRVQHPLLEKVHERFSSNKGVVFLSLNADEDRGLVAPFLKQQHWSDRVYFESGLGEFYNISSIPTVMIFNKSKQLSSRMSGLDPSTFEEILTAKINQALKE